MSLINMDFANGGGNSNVKNARAGYISQLTTNTEINVGFEFNCLFIAYYTGNGVVQYIDLDLRKSTTDYERWYNNNVAKVETLGSPSDNTPLNNITSTTFITTNKTTATFKNLYWCAYYEA